MSSDGRTDYPSSKFFKFNVSEPTTDTHELVRCSYIEDGPRHFAVQLKNEESMLDQMMTRLAKADLRNLIRQPSIGMACIARSSEDLCFRRSIIVSIQPQACCVTFVDYGNSEMVDAPDMYEMPFEFLEQKPFAFHFGLRGVEQLEPMDLRIKEFFSILVRQSILKMKVVMPSIDEVTCVNIQCCELYTKGSSILQLLKKKQIDLKGCTDDLQDLGINSWSSVTVSDSHKFVSRTNIAAGCSNRSFNTAFSDLSLNARCSQITIVFWVSPHEFYVHLKSHAYEFDDMIKQMQMNYRKRALTQTRPAIGSIVIVYDYEESVFKRCRILATEYTSHLKLNKYRMQALDYGNKRIFECEFGDFFDLKYILASLPMMAVRCSLHHIISNYNPNGIPPECIYAYIDPTRKIQCDFISKIDGVTYVELEVDKVSLKQTLVTDRIVTSLPAECEMKRLTGQVIFIRPIFIENLSFFRVKTFGCDITFNCCYNNSNYIEQNEALSVKFKHQYERQTFMAKIESVTNDNVLMLTLYIPLLAQEIPPLTGIPGYAIYYSSYNSQVCSVEAVNVVYIQSYRSLSQISEYLDVMHDFYSTGGIPMADPRIGSLCAVLSSDGNYYRGHIREVDTNDTIRIHYIDYGKDEWIPLANLKQLDARHRSQSAFCIKAYLPIECVANAEATKVQAAIIRMTEQLLLSTDIIECYRNQWIVNIDIIKSGMSLSARLSEIGLTRDISVATLRQQIDTDIELQVTAKSGPSEMPLTQSTELVALVKESATPITSIPAMQSADPGRYCWRWEASTEDVIHGKCNISYVYNIGDFYIQMENIWHVLDEMEEHLLSNASRFNRLKLQELKADHMCAALFHDNLYYRARVLADQSANTEAVQVFCVDYGNIFTTTDIRFLPEILASMPPMATKCELKKSNAIQSWSNEARAKFVELSDRGVEVFSFRLIKPAVRTTAAIVELLIMDRNVADELAVICLPRPARANGQATINVTCMPPVDSRVLIYVTSAHSPHDFYVQMDSKTTELNELINLMLGNFAPVEPNCILTDDIYAGLFENVAYYRCKVIEKCGSTYRVLFIDYGTLAETDDIRTIPDKLKRMPAMSIHCQLEDKHKEWNIEQIRNFIDIVTIEGVTFQLEIVDSTSSPQTVRLFQADETNVLDTIASSRAGISFRAHAQRMHYEGLWVQK